MVSLPRRVAATLFLAVVFLSAALAAAPDDATTAPTQTDAGEAAEQATGIGESIDRIVVAEGIGSAPSPPSTSPGKKGSPSTASSSSSHWSPSSLSSSSSSASSSASSPPSRPPPPSSTATAVINSLPMGWERGAPPSSPSSSTDGDTRTKTTTNKEAGGGKGSRPFVRGDIFRPGMYDEVRLGRTDGSKLLGGGGDPAVEDELLASDGEGGGSTSSGGVASSMASSGSNKHDNPHGGTPRRGALTQRIPGDTLDHHGGSSVALDAAVLEDANEQAAQVREGGGAGRGGWGREKHVVL